MPAGQWSHPGSWPVPMALASLVVGAAALMSSSEAAAAPAPQSASAGAAELSVHVASAVAAGVPRAAGVPQVAGVPPNLTHPPRDPFLPLTGPVAPAAGQVPTAPTLPGQTVPGQTVPGQTVPGQSPPSQSGTGQPGQPAAPVPSGGSRHVVVRGETLWSIAADASPRGSSTAAVAARMSQIYRANRAAIGPSPSHLVTGTVLVIPGASYTG